MTPTTHTGGGTFPARRTPTAREIAGVTSLELPPAFGSGDFFKPLSGGMWIARTIKTRRAWAGGVMAVTTCHPSAAAWKIADTLEVNGWEKSPLSTQPPSATPKAGRSGLMEDAFRRMPSRSRSSDRPALNFFPQPPDRRTALSTQGSGWRSVATDWRG